VIFRPRPSPLHAARASAGSVYCVVLAVVALSFEHPLVLGCVLAAVVAAGFAAGVGRSVLRGLAWAVPFAIVIALVNALVVREGLTVLVRFGELPPFGQIDVTLEALGYGAILGLRAMAVIGCFVLHSAAVDPDELLRSFRRLGFRSALTAALATRMVPVLARDARRVHDAQRCRAVGGASRAGVVRAVAAGSLDRATDVAATLEVRGYATARRPPRSPRPCSRHDLAFAAAAVGLALLGLAAALGGWESFSAYPRLEAPIGPEVLALCAALVAVMLLPFADRRGIRR
jgi:energy-coupling factor transport system permease protein